MNKASLPLSLDPDTSIDVQALAEKDSGYHPLMSQVAGRAGRRGKQGLVLIQTAQPLHPLLGYVQRSDYRAMFNEQLADRRAFLYPPFARLVKLTLRHRSEQLLHQAAQVLAQHLKAAFGARLLGPEVPLISRIQDRHLINFLLKIERGKPVEKPKEQLKAGIAALQQQAAFRSVEVVADVDPM